MVRRHLTDFWMRDEASGDADSWCLEDTKTGYDLIPPPDDHGRDLLLYMEQEALERANVLASCKTNAELERAIEASAAGKRLYVPLPELLDEGACDLVDLLHNGGGGSGAGNRKRIKVVRGADLEIHSHSADLVNGVIGTASLGVMYGHAKIGKSFVALHMAMCIATGRDFFGRSVQPGTTLYVAGEGGRGFGRRRDAWMNAHTPSVADDHYVLSAVPLTQADAMDGMLAAVEEIGPDLRLIVVDTLARAFGGRDENNAMEMSGFVENMASLSQASGATVLVVHHASKGDDLRGSSALRGAADTIMRLNGDADRLTLLCEGQKDGAPFEPIPLRLVGTGGSCIVEESEEPAEMAGNDPVTTILLALKGNGDGGLSAPELVEQTGISLATIYRRLGVMHPDGLVAKTGSRFRITAEGLSLIDSDQG